MLIFPFFFFFLLSFESECSICCFNIFSSFAKVLCPEKALLWVHCDSVSHGVMWSYPVWCVLEFQSECEVIKEADNGSRFLTVFIWKWSKVGLHVQILGLDFGYSFTLLDWLCTCTMCSLRSDSMPTEPLFFYLFLLFIPFSLDVLEKFPFSKRAIGESCSPMTCGCSYCYYFPSEMLFLKPYNLVSNLAQELERSILVLMVMVLL